MSQDLLKQIDDLVASKTFSLDALDAIKKLKDDLSKQITETEYLQKKYDGLYDTSNKQSEEIQRLVGVVHNLQEQTTQLKAGELKAREAVWEKLIAEAKAVAYEDALKTVFKPATVRETVYQTIPISQNYNGSTSVVPYHQETKTTKEEL